MKLMETSTFYTAKPAVILPQLFQICIWKKKIHSMVRQKATKSMGWPCADERSMLLRKSYGSVMILLISCRHSYRGTILKKNYSEKMNAMSPKAL